jgi:Tol biopolymer transport system component
MVDGIQGPGRSSRRCASRRHRRTWLGPCALTTIVVSIALAAASAASGQAQRSSAKPQWILFTARAPALAVEEIYRITTAGTGLEQLTKSTSPSAAPAFSPDGKRIAFARLGTGILTMNLDGTGVRRLTTNGRDNLPAWSPDGKRIAFLRPSASGWGVYVMSASGAGQRRLRLAPPAGRPSWTSRGLVIPTEGDLARIDPESGRVFRRFGATIDAIVGTNATSVAPDLSSIAFVGSGPQDPGDKDCGDNVACPRFALYVEEIAKHKPPRILVRDAGPASYSPDGKTLAFVEQNRIVLWQLANGTSRKIKAGKLLPMVASPPAWQPR